MDKDHSKFVPQIRRESRPMKTSRINSIDEDEGCKIEIDSLGFSQDWSFPFEKVPHPPGIASTVSELNEIYSISSLLSAARKPS